MKREWDTLKEMGEKLDIPIGTWNKQTPGWIQEREAMEKEADLRAYDMMIENRALLVARMYKRQLETAIALQVKASKRLFSKKLENGVEVDEEFDSQGIALSALRVGVSVEQSLIRRPRQEGEGVEGSGSSTMPDGRIIDIPSISLGNGGQRALREYTGPGLQRMLEDLDDQLGNETNGSARDAGKAAGKK